MENIPAIGDLIYEILSFCLEEEHHSSLVELAAAEGVTFEQYVAAAIAFQISQNFVVVPNSLPGVPKKHERLDTLRQSLIKPSESSPKLFISYRRGESRAMVERIFDHFRVEFGDNLVFKDTTSMPSGISYRQVIAEVIGKSAAVVAVIGPNWATCRNPKGDLRLFDPLDPVRNEIEAALSGSKPIFPLLIDGASIPPRDCLPTELLPLREFTAIPVRYDPDFQSDIQTVIDTCRKFCGQDYRARSLPIPQLPIYAKLPVRVLAGCANTIREALIGELSGSSISELNKDERSQLELSEAIVTGWCKHFGIIDPKDF